MKHSGYIFEIAVWALALVMLSIAGPGEHQHVTLCPLAGLGFSWCPGCGLGRSVASILHGEFIQSFHYHWFGLPALLILFCRILSLGKKIKVSFQSKSII